MENKVNKVSEDKFKGKLSEYVNDTLSELLLYDNVALKNAGFDFIGIVDKLVNENCEELYKTYLASDTLFVMPTLNMYLNTDAIKVIAKTFDINSITAQKIKRNAINVLKKAGVSEQKVNEAYPEIENSAKMLFANFLTEQEFLYAVREHFGLKTKMQAPNILNLPRDVAEDWLWNCTMDNVESEYKIPRDWKEEVLGEKTKQELDNVYLSFLAYLKEIYAENDSREKIAGDFEYFFAKYYQTDYEKYLDFRTSEVLTQQAPKLMSGAVNRYLELAEFEDDVKKEIIDYSNLINYPISDLAITKKGITAETLGLGTSFWISKCVSNSYEVFKFGLQDLYSPLGFPKQELTYMFEQIGDVDLKFELVKQAGVPLTED